MGEAAKRISTEFREKNPEVPFSDLARTRDKMIHGYEEIDFDMLWTILSVDVPRLLVQFSEIHI